jgi:hypothetical protein
VLFASYQGGLAADYREKVPYETYVAERMAAFRNLGVRQIIVLGPIPTWTADLPKILARRFLFAGQPIPLRTSVGLAPVSLETDQRMRGQAFADGITYVSLRDALCNDQGCQTVVGDNPQHDVIVFDYGHLTPAGAQFVTSRILVPLISPVFDAAPRN